MTRYLKAAAKIGMGVVGLAVVALAWSRRGGSPEPQRTSLAKDFREVARKFEVRSFPQDCPQAMRFEGCEKKRWTCDQDDGTWAYKCCCDTDIWAGQVQATRQASAAAVAVHSGKSVLRLEKSMNVCLAGPEDGGSHFALGSCRDTGAALKLPPQGAGVIELADKPGKCLSVTTPGGNLRKALVEVAPCNHGSMEQMFQLTNGDKGMIQWSHGGNKCLDSEGESTKAGSKIVLADCVYWPLKPSQVFVLEDAPKPKPKGDAKKDAAANHPSLFCTSLMLPWSYEVGMMRSQYERQCGIFQCDGWAVFSNERVKLNDGAPDSEDPVYCDIINGSLKAKIGGKFHTALNTPVFRRYWLRIMEDGRAWAYDWITKVDPDCVFFPLRLKGMLANEYKPSGTPGKAVWLNNCQLGLHGPLEVFSKQALGAYKDSDGACDSVAEEHGQEDVYMAHCFTKLQVPRVDAFNTLLESEWACNERPSSSSHMPPCYDRQVSFHPFKSVETYFNCYDRAVKMHWNTPLYFNGVPPSPNNQHHA